MTRSSEEMHGEILDDAADLTLEELVSLVRVDETWIEEMIAQGVIAPRDGQARHFSALTITTVRKARRLQQDFRLNPEGVALALELLGEIERLRLELKRH